MLFLCYTISMKDTEIIANLRRTKKGLDKLQKMCYNIGIRKTKQKTGGKKMLFNTTYILNFFKVLFFLLALIALIEAIYKSLKD